MTIRYIETYTHGFKPNNFVYDHCAKGYPKDIIDYIWHVTDDCCNRSQLPEEKLSYADDDGEIFYYWNDIKNGSNNGDFSKWCNETKRIRHNIKAVAERKKKIEQARKDQKLTNGNRIQLLRIDSLEKRHESSIQELNDKIDTLTNVIKNMVL